IFCLTTNVELPTTYQRVPRYAAGGAAGVVPLEGSRWRPMERPDWLVTATGAATAYADWRQGRILKPTVNKLATELARNEELSSAIMSLNCKIEKLTQKMKYKDNTIEQLERIINNVKCKTVVTDRYVQTDPSSKNSIHVQTQAVTSNSTQTQTQLTPIQNQPKRDKNPRNCIKANTTEANTTEDKRVLPLDQFAITSMLHPNSQLNNIIKDARKLTTDFTKSDYVLIMDGSNEALTKGFIQCEPLRETLKVLKATNVIIASCSTAMEMS
ncbi:unnamed protein product, partial [Acanthoscelides obtectus]